MRESSTSTFQGRLIQTAFITDDIHASMRELTRTLGAGPWFLRERGVFPKQIYQGQPAQTALAIALGYAGEMQFEIIQQLDDSHGQLFRTGISPGKETGRSFFEAVTGAYRHVLQFQPAPVRGCNQNGQVTITDDQRIVICEDTVRRQAAEQGEAQSDDGSDVHGDSRCWTSLAERANDLPNSTTCCRF